MNSYSLNDSPPKTKIVLLLCLLLFLTAVVFIGEFLTQRIPKAEYSKMKYAAEKMQTLIRTVYNARTEKGDGIDIMTDPLQSGLIGVEFSPITTTLGNLEAKHTALNADFAALMVTWLTQCEVAENDRIAIQASASFPALTFAAIIACETLNLQPVISVSLGSSSYGANMSGFTYLDMEKIVLDSMILENECGLITPGGTDDNGSSMWDGAQNILAQAIIRSGKSLFTPHTLRESIEKKLKYFNDDGEVRVFINIGGNHASLGNGNCAYRIPSGLINHPLHCNPSRSEDGLIIAYNRSGIPVIHVLNIRDLAASYGLLFLPHRTQKAGESEVYYNQKKPYWFYALSLLIVLFWSMWIGRKKL